PVQGKNGEIRRGRQSGCPSERPDDPLRLGPRPVTLNLTADHPHPPRLDATPIRPRRTITRGSAPLAVDPSAPGPPPTTPGAPPPPPAGTSRPWHGRPPSPRS